MLHAGSLLTPCIVDRIEGPGHSSGLATDHDTLLIKVVGCANAIKIKIVTAFYFLISF